MRPHDPSQLVAGLERERTLFEHKAQPTLVEAPVVMIRPMADLPLFLGEMPDMPPPRFESARAFLKANDAFRRRLLDRLGRPGRWLRARSPDTSETSWLSSGWTTDRTVAQMLELLAWRGEVAVSARRGGGGCGICRSGCFRRTWTPSPSEEARSAARRALAPRARDRAAEVRGRCRHSGRGRGDEEREWRLDPEATAEGFEGRTAILSPFDRLSHDRARALDLFDFQYTLEMYKPKEQRRWGYFALPVLHGDQLVGKIDATADRDASTVRVDAIHEDLPFARAVRGAVDDELAALARWLGLDGVKRA